MRFVRVLAASAMFLSLAPAGMAAATPDHSMPLQLVRGGGGGFGGHSGGFHGHVGGFHGGWAHHHRGRYDGYPYTYACPYPYYYNYAYCPFPNG
ncbi:MAG TPA: hypothetical protein VL614_11010 [Acetobacteraceae bacterium]|jgi:hypothetical protein|nr:hypothetical protein [Acetobacteraceae bacterium]